MIENKVVKDTANALGIGSVLPAVYNDLLSPAVRELGDGLVTLAKAVKIALAPIEATVWGYERIREWLAVRVTRILADRKATDINCPPLSISGPLILHMVFSSEEPDLREMYARLLASAMDSRTSGDAHPSFVSIIQQLTADEAKIVAHIASLEKVWPNWSGKASGCSAVDNNLWKQMRQVCADAMILHGDKADLYIENLLRLRLLQYITSAEASYHPAGHDNHGDWGPHVTTDEYEFIELTAYGRGFINACVADSVVRAGTV